MTALQTQMEETKQINILNMQLVKSRINADNPRFIRNSILPVSMNISPPIQTPDHHTENAEEFKQYCSTIGDMLQKVHRSQLIQLKNKYRFYLTKVEKLEKVKLQLENKFDRLEQIVNESPPVREQTDSIQFIKKISSETERKLNILQAKVTKQKEIYKQSMKHIQGLKQKLKKQKDNFFQLKRLGLKINLEYEASERASKLQNANQTFINIVNEKVAKNKTKIQGIIQVEKSLSNSGSESVGKQMNLTQISSRLSSLQIMQNKFLKQQLSLIQKFKVNHKLHIKHNQLPNIQSKSNSRESFNQILLLKDNKKQKYYFRKIDDLIKNLECPKSQINAMYLSQGFKYFMRDQNRIQSELAYQQIDKVNVDDKKPIKSKIRKSKSKSKRDKIMICKLNKIQKMKQQLVKQAEHLEHQQQILQICPLAKKHGNPSIFMTAKFKQSPQNVLQPLQKLVKQHKTICKDQEKQCQACEQNMKRLRITQQKFSLHKTDINKLKNKLQNFDERKSINAKQLKQSDHRALDNYQNLARYGTDQNQQAQNQDSLIIGDQTLFHINQARQEKQAFLDMTPEKILRKIVEKKKINQVLRLMEKENVYIVPNKKIMKQIR